MIISRIDGGLGNQMFQYAYGLYLAQRNQTELLLDTSSYASGPQHGYLLDRFSISSRRLNHHEQELIPTRYREDSGESSDAQGLGNILLGNFFGPQLRRHKESTFGFQRRHLRVRDNRYLVGYWQSEKFYPGLRDRLLQEFQPVSPLSATSQQYAEQISTCSSVAIHVRRGDYVKDPAAAAIYENLSANYYHRCVKEFQAYRPGTHVFIFSNDIPWCRENLSFDAPTHFVDHNNGATAHEDMLLMSKAACCVIANSTFSWWAAWLNNRPQKTVFAPLHWFRPGTLRSDDILCESWQGRSDPDITWQLQAA